MNHSFDVNLAIEYGVNAAIIFQSIAWWCEHSRANNAHFHDGRFWTYNSNRAFQKLFPYMSGKQITTAIDKLIAAGVIIKGNYNNSPYDRTLWYAVTELGESKFRKGEMEKSEMSNQNSENVEPIPVISTVISTVVDDDNARARTIDNNNDFNPFGDDCPDLPTDTLETYAANNIVNMNGRNMELLVGYLDVMPESLIRYAIDLANKCCKTGVPPYSYVEKILMNLVKQKIKTVEQAKALEAVREAEKERSLNARSAPNRPAQNVDNRLLNMPFTT